MRPEIPAAAVVTRLFGYAAYATARAAGIGLRRVTCPSVRSPIHPWLIEFCLANPPFPFRLLIGSSGEHPANFDDFDRGSGGDACLDRVSVTQIDTTLQSVLKKGNL